MLGASSERLDHIPRAVVSMRGPRTSIRAPLLVKDVLRA